MPLIAGENEKLGELKRKELAQAKDYLCKQLARPNPNSVTIAGVVKGYVDANATLLQMVNNQIALLRNAHAWPILDLLLPLGANRYLLAVQLVAATLP